MGEILPLHQVKKMDPFGRLMRSKLVCEFVGVSRTKLFMLQKRDRNPFPQPIRGEDSPLVHWIETDVVLWMQREQAWEDEQAASVRAAEQRKANAPRKVGQTPNNIYFIAVGEDGPIKIGVSNDPRRRLSSLQTAHHQELKLLAVVGGGSHREAQLHERFKHLRIRGEWFARNPELVTYIAGLAGAKGGER